MSAAVVNPELPNIVFAGKPLPFPVAQGRSILEEVPENFLRLTSMGTFAEAVVSEASRRKPR